MLERTGETYANTPGIEAFLVRGKPEYVGDYLDRLNTRLYPFWDALTEALRTGRPQNEAKHGGDLFGAIYGTPDLLPASRCSLEAGEFCCKKQWGSATKGIRQSTVASLRNRAWTCLTQNVVFLSRCAHRVERSLDHVSTSGAHMASEKHPASDKIEKTSAEWRELLTPEQYHILREAGTERPFTGKYWNLHEDGNYSCAGCGQLLFTSAMKFASTCGWPSFYDVDPAAVETFEDFSHGMHRIEVRCSRCGGHLGHVFDDGPRPTGQRYCINSASLNFVRAQPAEK
jgi:peptide-methionine (R)-S-oxide reductase